MILDYVTVHFLTRFNAILACGHTEPVQTTENIVGTGQKNQENENQRP